MCKVVLARERSCPWFERTTTELRASLPYWQPDNGGYVHMVRSARIHHGDDNKAGLRYTTYKFWCGGGGFLYPPSVPVNRRGGRGIGMLLAEPSPGRVVCATCIGRAIGSGQHPEHRNRIEGLPVKFTPRHGFLRPLPERET